MRSRKSRIEADQIGTDEFQRENRKRADRQDGERDIRPSSPGHEPRRDVVARRRAFHASASQIPTACRWILDAVVLVFDLVHRTCVRVEWAALPLTSPARWFSRWE